MSMSSEAIAKTRAASLPGRSFVPGLSARVGPFQTNRLLFALFLLAAALVPGELGEVTRGAMQDAYIGVAAFVAATLFLFYGAEKAFGVNIGTVFRNAKYAQVPLASCLGALPGCGGAVVVVAAYSSGNVSMGSVVATLTATMGDAAFLLIAKRPDAAIVLLPIAFATGIISGYIVDLLDKREFDRTGSSLEVTLIGKHRLRDTLYAIIFVPGIVLGVMALAQVEHTGIMATFESTVALTGIGIGLFVWAASPLKALTNSRDKAITRVTEETSFITAWVIAAFLIFEYLNAFAGLDLEALFKTVGVLLPMMAILVGFIPGCGPQILVTTFYINGLVPFSALIGNAIANDGDALFPAIALNPRAALLATVYSAIPALLIAYGFYFFAPGFL
jgi:hypothetical protein